MQLELTTKFGTVNGIVCDGNGRLSFQLRGLTVNRVVLYGWAYLYWNNQRYEMDVRNSTIERADTYRLASDSARRKVRQALESAASEWRRTTGAATALRYREIEQREQDVIGLSGDIDKLEEQLREKREELERARKRLATARASTPADYNAAG